jgi:hypothetical protein
MYWVGTPPLAPSVYCFQCTHSHKLTGARKDTDNKNFRDFRRQLFHGSLTVIHKPLERFMHDWDVIWCSDHHFRRAIYGLGPYIADYPEQTAAAGTVYNWVCNVSTT